MRNLVVLGLISVFLFSCNTKKPPFYSSNLYYKGTVIEDDTIDLALTFIDDTIAAFSEGNFESPEWIFLEFEKLNDALFLTDELKIDTMWIKRNGDSLHMYLNPALIGGIQADVTFDMFFRKLDLSQNFIDSLHTQIVIAKRLSDKGITFAKSIPIEKVSYFYNAAVAKARMHLKSPDNAKFNSAYIYKDYLFNFITKVSLDIDAQNSFGVFMENTYYVYFFPREGDSTRHHVEISEDIMPFDLYDKYGIDWRNN